MAFNKMLDDELKAMGDDFLALKMKDREHEGMRAQGIESVKDPHV